MFCGSWAQVQILVLNSGSSSIKFSVFQAPAQGEPEATLEGELSGIGGNARLQIHGLPGGKSDDPAAAGDAAGAIALVLDTVKARSQPEAVGYRVVHPGARLKGHQRITPRVLEALDAAADFAPLHDPDAVNVIKAGMRQFPAIPHFACFDTVFHETMPPAAFIYPIPLNFLAEGVRRYGFHGLSCESIVHRMRQDSMPIPGRMAIAHLGSGCSVTALLDGRSVDNTMGLTPTGGVVMGTRPGDLDPGLMFFLMRQHGGSESEASHEVEAMLNHKSGLVGLTGLANDVKAMRQAAASGDAGAVLALTIFTRSVTRALGGFAWLLGGLDTIVFTGGIGEHDAATRAEVLAGLEPLGVALDGTRNREHGARRISAGDSRTQVLVIPAEEDLTIARHVLRLSQSSE